MEGVVIPWLTKTLRIRMILGNILSYINSILAVIYLTFC